MSALNPFKKTKNTSSYFLTVDVGSKNCKVLLFEKKPAEDDSDPSLKVVGSSKVAQREGAMYVGIPLDIRNVTETLEEAVAEAKLFLEGAKVKDSFLGLSGEMVSYLTTRMRLSRGNPDKEISEKELRRIEDKAHRAAYMEACKEISARKGRTDLEAVVINSAVTDVEVDEFPATDPIGFKGEKVELSFFNAVAPQERLLTLENILRSARLNVQAITSGMYAVLLALLKEKDIDDFSGLFIDIGGQKTDIGVVFENAIVSSRTLPLGGEDFSEAVAEEKSISIGDAERRKISFSEKELEDSDVQRALSKAGDIWASSLKTALSEMESVEALPSDIYLFGGGAELPILSEKLADSSWGDSLPIPGTVDIRVLDPGDFKFCTDETGELGSSAWVLPLALGYVDL